MMEPQASPELPCDHYATRIQDVVDGLIAAEDRQALDTHLVRCASCRALLADLRDIRQAAGELPPYTPRPEVWTRIARAITAERAAAPRTFWTGTRVAFALAATLVVAVGSSLLVLRAPAPVAPTAATTAAAPVHQPKADLVQDVDEHLRIADENYEKAILGLEQIVKAGQGSLDPKVAVTLQKNLGVIDQAIRESRQAIMSQPHSELVQTSLFEALRQKVALLEDTIALINVMRKGDQAGAARIIGGLSKS